MGPTMNSNKREPTKGARLWQLTQGRIQLGNLYCVVDREHTWLRRKMWSTGQVVDRVRRCDSKAAGGFAAESEALTYLWFCFDMFHYMHGKKLSLDISICQQYHTIGKHFLVHIHVTQPCWGWLNLDNGCYMQYAYQQNETLIVYFHVYRLSNIAIADFKSTCLHNQPKHTSNYRALDRSSQRQGKIWPKCPK